MASQLNQVVTFTNLAAGGSQTLPHNINVQGRQYVPDLILRDNFGFTVTAVTDAAITVRNDNSAPATLNVWLQLQHSIDREYGGTQNTGLTPNPFVVGSSISGLLNMIILPIAAAQLDSTTGLYTVQNGFVGNPVKNGVGDWTLQYSTPLNTDQGLVLATVQDQGGSGQRENITVQSIDATHIRVRTFKAGAVADQHFWVMIARIQ